jgi:predicted DCC family thiol-disulfide oxidoreductase YuxK
LCSREIAHYQKLKSTGCIRWIDVTREPELVRGFGIEPRDAMALFHVLDDRGQLVQGAAAFITLWRALPGYRFLAALCTRLHLLPVLEWGYRGFAARHFQKRCSEGACGP